MKMMMVGLLGAAIALVPAATMASSTNNTKGQTTAQAAGNPCKPGAKGPGSGANNPLCKPAGKPVSPGKSGK